MVEALLFFRSLVVFQKCHRFLEKSLVAKYWSLISYTFL